MLTGYLTSKSHMTNSLKEVLKIRGIRTGSGDATVVPKQLTGKMNFLVPILRGTGALQRKPQSS